MSFLGKAFSSMVMNIAGIDEEDDSSHHDTDNEESTSNIPQERINPFISFHNEQRGQNRPHRVNRDEPTFDGL